MQRIVISKSHKNLKFKIFIFQGRINLKAIKICSGLFQNWNIIDKSELFTLPDRQT